MGRYHATSVLSLTARHPAWAERLDFKRFILAAPAKMCGSLIQIGLISSSLNRQTCSPPLKLGNY